MWFPGLSLYPLSYTDKVKMSSFRVVLLAESVTDKYKKSKIEEKNILDSNNEYWLTSPISYLQSSRVLQLWSQSRSASPLPFIPSRPPFTDTAPDGRFGIRFWTRLVLSSSRHARQWSTRAPVTVARTTLCRTEEEALRQSSRRKKKRFISSLLHCWSVICAI